MYIFGTHLFSNVTYSIYDVLYQATGDNEEESESEVEMEDEDDEDEIPLEMEDIEAVSKKARQDDDLNTEHLQVCEWE